jgi:hypothetical protein
MLLNNPNIIPAQGSLLPELFPFLKTITALQPEASASITPMLEKFCDPWLEQHMAGLPVHHSLLTPSGYPVEFTFRSDTDDVCYTAEPGLPQAGAMEKQQFVEQLTRQFDFHTGILQQLAAQHGQRFGNWLSVRHRKEQTAFKLYQEITPSGVELFHKTIAANIPALANTTTLLQPMLAGFTGGGEIAEFYCRIVQPDVNNLHTLFSAAGIAGRLPYMLNILSYLAGEETSSLLKWLRLGISFRATGDDMPELSVFVHVPQIFTSNATARKRILGLVRQINGAMPVYEQLTAGLLSKDPGYPVHSIITLKPAASGKFSCAVGLSPWQTQA